MDKLVATFIMLSPLNVEVVGRVDSGIGTAVEGLETG